MSKMSEDWYSLPPLQKRIVLSLAEKGPQTKNEVKENVKSAYKNILYSFKSLQDKGLIHVIGQKFYRRQKFDKFWLTGIGVALAILHDGNHKVISNHIEDTYPHAEEMHLILSLTKVLGKKSLELALYMILSHPLEEAISKLSVIALLEPKKYTSKNAETLIREVDNVLKAHPSYHKKYVNTWRKISDLSRIVEKEGVKP